MVSVSNVHLPIFPKLTQGLLMQLNVPVQSSTSVPPDFGFVTGPAYDGSTVNVELWDFPGAVAGMRSGPLLSTFFHAAIICFSLENKDNLRNVVDVVRDSSTYLTLLGRR